MSIPAPKRTRRTRGLSPATRARRGLPLPPVVTVTVNVSGGVMTEQDLAGIIQASLLKRASNNWRCGV